MPVIPVIVSVFFAGKVADADVGGVRVADEQSNVAFLRFVVCGDGERHIVVLNDSSDFHVITSSFLRIEFSVHGDDFTRNVRSAFGAGAQDDMFRVVFGAGEVAVRHSLVASHGNDFNAFVYEEGAELPHCLKFAVAVRDKADVRFGVIPRNSEIVIHCCTS